MENNDNTIMENNDIARTLFFFYNDAQVVYGCLSYLSKALEVL